MWNDGGSGNRSAGKKNHIIIGTAGHVDHGKTCLVKALTGIDTDRLKEEKKRGITIELGFAYLELPDGEVAGIVDVPGHEHFIRNMLAGAGGIDIAMLVVAADEGVMPQTVEHLEILSLLGIPRGMIVITKTDLADSELCDLVEEEIRDTVAGTFLENAPIMRTSVHNQTGLEPVKQELYQLAAQAEKKRLDASFRMPVDRVFTMKGFGTIVTGTLIEGKITGKEDAVLYPGGRKVKIRSMQVHGNEAAAAYAGQRVAVNLSNLKKEEISRGEILAPNHSMETTRMIDVRLKLLKNASFHLHNRSRVHFYHGTAELLCRIVMVDVQELGPGEQCFAQLHLEGETAVKAGDPFVIRFYSPVETIGGGVVLDPHPFKYKKGREHAVEDMQTRETGSGKDRLEIGIRTYSPFYKTTRELLPLLSMETGEMNRDLEVLTREKKIVPIAENLYLHRSYLVSVEKDVEGLLTEFHKENPLKEGMSKEEVRSRISKGRQVDGIDGILDYLVEKKAIKIQQGRVSNYRFRVRQSTDDCQISDKIIAIYREAGYKPPDTEEITAGFQKEKGFRHVFSALIVNKTLIRLDEKHYLLSEYYNQAIQTAKKLYTDRGEIVLGEYRDVLGISRRCAVSLLEGFDRKGITRKQGDVRVFRKEE